MKKRILIGIILAIILALAIIIFRPVSSKEVFTKTINGVIDYAESKYTQNASATNTTITLSGNIETSNNQIKEFAQYINDGKLIFNVQTDSKAKKVLVSTDIDYKDESLVSGKVYFQNDNNVYIYVQDLFDKYLKYSINDLVGENTSIKEFLDGDASEKNNLVKASKILKNEIEKNLKDEYFTQDNEKNIMKISSKELETLINNIITSLKDNEEFLNCFENKDEIKNQLENTIKEFSNKKSEEIFYIEISIYTKGIKKDIEKVEIKVIKEEKTLANISVKTENVDTNTKKYILETDQIEGFGKATLNIELKESSNTDFDNVYVEDSVDIKNMSPQDTLKMYTNLTKMKIYQFIAPFLQDIQ